MRDDRKLAGGALHWQAALATLEILHFTFGTKAAALFGLRIASGAENAQAPALSLVAAQNVTQAALDGVSALWASARDSLLGGQPSGDDQPPFLLLPCRDERGCAGLVYLEGADVFRRSRLALLASLAPFLASILHRLDGRDDIPEPAASLGQQPRSANAEAAELHVLLDHNEWNVSRVARILGVTRMTVYNRLRRLAVPRRRVAKGARASAPHGREHGAPAARRGAGRPRSRTRG